MSNTPESTAPSEYLHTPREPDRNSEHARYPIDIVFVHGLNLLSKANFAESTWTYDNGNFWPVDLLPQRIPSARIHIFSYNSRVAWDTSTNGIQQHANNLLDRLSGAREDRPIEGDYNVPIIFVAHSLGGLVVKQALVTAKNNDTFADLRKNTYGLIFFAVPHQGGRGASLGKIAKNIVTSLTGNNKNDLIESLCANSLFQENQATFFRHQLEDYYVVSICETKPTKIKHLAWATPTIVVDEKSATLSLAGTRERLITIDSNHSNVCKFEADNDKYDPVKRAIGRLADGAIALKESEADLEAPARSLTSNQHDPASDADPQSTVPMQPQQDNEHFELPLDSNKNYVERPSITSQLEDLLKVSKSNAASRAVRVVLYGLGGAGKTELAVRFAERHRRRYKAVFWVYGADASRLKEGFERIGKAIDRNINGPHRDLVLDAQAWFVNNGDWLLIVDNVDEEDALSTLRWQYLKGGMNGHILVTSRNPSTSVYWDGIEVADMNKSEAIDLVMNITGRQSEAEDTNLSRLLGDLGHLPLAIDQASSYMAATGMSIKKYHRWFEIEKARLLKEVPSTNYNYDSQQTIMTTWEISFQRVEQSNFAASELLLMMSIFSHDDIPIAMLQLNDDSLRHWAPNGEWEALPKDQKWVRSGLQSTLNDGLRLRDAIRSLRKFSFIRYKPGGDSFWLHPLVHYWASQKLKAHPDQQKLTMCSIGLVASSFKKEDRLPPIATPYGKRDDASVGEEKTLRLWPLRQYLNLLPHAHRCLKHVTSLASMPEAIAHLSLSLLQVLEYISTADDPVVVERLVVEKAHAVIDHAERFGEAPDEYLKYSATLWRLTRAAVCNCQKHAAVMSNRCHRCRQATGGAVRLIEDVIAQPAGTSRTPRIRATILGFLFVIFLDHGQLLDVFEIPDFKFRFNPFRAGRNWARSDTIDYGSLFNGIPFSFCNINSSASLLERYVYNVGGYFLVRFAVESEKLSTYSTLPKQSC